LKATEHDKYENSAGLVWLSLFICSNGNAFYCPRRLARAERNSIFTPINSTISIHPKRWYAYGGKHVYWYIKYIGSVLLTIDNMYIVGNLFGSTLTVEVLRCTISL
jgi:hypothetical protein